MPAAERAAAIAVNPEKSDRAIAAESGLATSPPGKARKRTASNLAVEKRTGRDGKQRKAPTMPLRSHRLAEGGRLQPAGGERTGGTPAIDRPLSGKSMENVLMVRQSLIAVVACVALVSSALAQGGGGGGAGGGGAGGAGSGSSGAGGTSSSSGSSFSGTSGTGGLSPAGGRSGAPVATSRNPTSSSQGASTPTMATSGNRSGATTTNPSTVGTAGGAQSNTTGRGAGTAPNGVPIGNPGSGKGSPENPW